MGIFECFSLILFILLMILLIGYGIGVGIYLFIDSLFWEFKIAGLILTFLSLLMLNGFLVELHKNNLLPF
jgi:hypothetical protein